MTKTFYSHGKLLLSSEYLVLDGALALAVPTRRGQQLVVATTDRPELQWKSTLVDGSSWITHRFKLPLESSILTVNPLVQRLHEILKAAQQLNPEFLATNKGYQATSTLEFPQNWGLGSSSTLITNIASWASIDPYRLLHETFGGSGYDIACAKAETPITFSLIDRQPLVKVAPFYPEFRDQLFFVHLNRKQNSRESIQHYRNLNQQFLLEEIDIFSDFTKTLIECDDLDTFEELIIEHEQRLSQILQTPTIKEQLFNEYPRAIKSLGGWGGDFVMVIGFLEEMAYFKNKGFATVISYEDMVLPTKL